MTRHVSRRGWLRGGGASVSCEDIKSSGWVIGSIGCELLRPPVGGGWSPGGGTAGEGIPPSRPSAASGAGPVQPKKMACRAASPAEGSLAQTEVGKSLAIELDIRREGFNELRHHRMGQNDSGHNHVGARQVPDKIKNKLGWTRHHNYARAHLASRDVLGNAGSNGRHPFRGIKMVIRRWEWVHPECSFAGV